MEAKKEIYNLVEDLAKDGKGVIFISSEFSEMVAICNRVIVLHEGRLVGEVDADAVTERNIIELCYGHVGAVAA